MPDPRGSIVVEATVSGRWAISLLTEGWTDEEKQGLLDGDQEAIDALEDAALRATMNEAHDVEDEHYRIEWSRPAASNPTEAQR